MKKIIITSIFGMAALAATAQTYELTAPRKWEPIRSEHLQMGGKAPDGGSIDVNNYYIVRDGKPVIPVMGEFHYSRYPAEQWEQEIIKMKAGGVNVIPSYIFWSLHEPVEGKFCWEGNLNLRRFIELCKKHDMDVIVRIGPFGHGEIRSGALPDWLFTKNLDVRSNDSKYLAYTKILYTEIAKQLQGLYYKDGGPIIGCQLENEHQHSAAPWAINYAGEKVLDFTAASYDKGITKLGVSVQEGNISAAELGDRHMATLQRMAEEAGIITPFYTATGWGNAAVIPGKAIPVTAGYTYPTWFPDQRKSDFCMFKNLWAEPDYSPVRYNPLDYPSASAEMGAGIQMVYDKRPVCTPEAAEALMLRCLAGGSNIIGYYMYHGGSTPRMNNGYGEFLSDQPMGLPKISYDFQAPLGEFGLEAPSFRPLRVIHNFLADFQHILAPMQPVMPENVKTMTPENRDDLRYAARMTPTGEGFLFLVNTQDHDLERHDQKDLRVKLNLPNETLTIPAEGGFTLPKNTSAILPFNFDMEGALLKYATAQPLMKIDDKGTAHYFFTVHDGMEPEFVFSKSSVKGKSEFTDIVPGFKSMFKVTPRGGKAFKVTVLTYADALNATKVNGKLLITEATVVPAAGQVKLLSFGKHRADYIVYPSKQGFKKQTVSVEPVSPKADVDKSVPWRMEVGFTERATDTPQVNEYFLSVPYTGDVAMAFMDNAMVLDHFWQGMPWRIGLNRFAEKMSAGKPLGFYFRPLRAEAPFLPDIPAKFVPDFSQGPVLEIGEPQIIPEYVMTILL
ncbi:beta-galactosidase [uncultured Bacteroides sp.]|uniref:beta-galactosidase n=1 Tax=uncultured Bacteroides sp. TaxID=162156 RepID=UPI0025917493|nr:beta-galactosidase [uncultured Bacteroides sp.]